MREVGAVTLEFQLQFPSRLPLIRERAPIFSVWLAKFGFGSQIRTDSAAFLHHFQPDEFNGYSKKKLKDKPNKYTVNENGNDRKRELTYRYLDIHKSPETSDLPSNLPALPDLPSNLPALPRPSERTTATCE